VVYINQVVLRRLKISETFLDQSGLRLIIVFWFMDGEKPEESNFGEHRIRGVKSGGIKGDLRF